jgi:hypothetical protein
LTSDGAEHRSASGDRRNRGHEASVAGVADSPGFCVGVGHTASYPTQKDQKVHRPARTQPDDVTGASFCRVTVVGADGGVAQGSQPSHHEDQTNAAAALGYERAPGNVDPPASVGSTSSWRRPLPPHWSSPQRHDHLIVTDGESVRLAAALDGNGMCPWPGRPGRIAVVLGGSLGRPRETKWAVRESSRRLSPETVMAACGEIFTTVG